MEFQKNRVFEIINNLFNLYYKTENKVNKLDILESIGFFIESSYELKENEIIMNKVNLILLKYINSNDFTCLGLYKRLFNGTKYYEELKNNIELLDEYPNFTITDLDELPKEIDNLENELHDELIKFKEKTNPKKIRHHIKYDIDELVGVKDKNGDFWLSRVLHIFKPEKSNVVWYYIHYEGFDDVFDEWVPCGKRIFKYNPYRCKYKKYVDYINSEKYKKIKAIKEKMETQI